jgi:hypothetical protein
LCSGVDEPGGATLLLDSVAGAQAAIESERMRLRIGPYWIQLWGLKPSDIAISTYQIMFFGVTTEIT